MSKKKPLILVTNDDGISAPGIRALISVMQELGDVVVVAAAAPEDTLLSFPHEARVANTISDSNNFFITSSLKAC